MAFPHAPRAEASAPHRPSEPFIETRLTRRLGLVHPVIQAPMAMAAGGALAAAVSRGGGLGLIGGGYAERDWIDREWRAAGNESVGIGFITWHFMRALEHDPALLDDVLAREPRAFFLSFADPTPLASRIRDAGVPLIAQVQTRRDGQRALEAGADVIVAQGSEAGGHGERRATMTLVPELVDLAAGTDTLVCAAGGIADGRGLAAALMLGADGVLVGSRFWASEEALVQPGMLDAAFQATGDDTIRSSVMDIARHLDWPDRYTARVLRNAFTERWHDDVEGLLAHAEVEAARWAEAWERGDPTVANTFVGEAAGLIEDAPPAARVMERMVERARALLDGGWRRTG